MNPLLVSIFVGTLAMFLLINSILLWMIAKDLGFIPVTSYDSADSLRCKKKITDTCIFIFVFRNPSLFFIITTTPRASRGAFSFYFSTVVNNHCGSNSGNEPHLFSALVCVKSASVCGDSRRPRHLAHKKF
jgi:hypothetical protein